ncbi:MAG: hypothetical protein KRP56_06375 [Candidatus Methanogranum gryphiswaldense]|nr:MAG: hypothetical protein KRP56_06375 [Candidatus Methanogranum sp. U3.2.1]
MVKNSTMVVAITLIAVTITAAFSVIMMTSDSDEQYVSPYESMGCYEDEITTVNNASDFDNVKEGGIILLGENVSADAEFYAKLKIAIDNGSPIISFNGPDVFKSPYLGRSVSYCEDTDFMGYYQNPVTGTIKCYGIEGVDNGESTFRLCEWADLCSEITESVNLSKETSET